MRFLYDGKAFAIDFNRGHVPLAQYEPELKQSKHPYTTVNILELDPTSINPKTGELTTKNATVFATATVGAWHRERKVNNELGRLRALRNVVRTLPKNMKPRVFEAYFNR